MFRFFKLKKWFLWSWFGSFIILSSLWVQVKIDVKINEWFGEFYDMIQKALSKPNSITMQEYWDSLFSFISLAGLYDITYTTGCGETSTISVTIRSVNNPAYTLSYDPNFVCRTGGGTLTPTIIPTNIHSTIAAGYFDPGNPLSYPNIGNAPNTKELLI